jgi:predicted oxidoreductase
MNLPKKRVIYGCMGFGGGWNTNPISKEDEKIAFEAIETALECGIDTFDHADIYANGKAEQVFGTILKQKPELREKIKIQTKAGIVLHGGINGSNIFNSSPEYLENQIRQSLKNLHTDYLDTFLLHRPDPLTDVREIAELFGFLRQEGIVREFGVSNMSICRFKSLQNYCDFSLTANQLQFSLHHSLLIDDGFFINKNADRQMNLIGGMLENSEFYDFEIQAWSPLAKGLYTNSESQPENKEVIETKTLLQNLAKKYNTDVTSIMLAWIFKLPYRISPVIGTVNPQRIRACADSLNINLEHEDWYNLYLTAKGIKLP